MNELKSKHDQDAKRDEEMSTDLFNQKNVKRLTYDDKSDALKKIEILRGNKRAALDNAHADYKPLLMMLTEYTLSPND